MTANTADVALMYFRCHDVRRSSPSVADWSPTSSWIQTASRIASSSTASNASAGMRPRA